MHLDGVDQIGFSIVVYRQEEEEQREGEGAGEDLCTPSAYNRRLRATQSPNYQPRSKGENALGSVRRSVRL